MQTFRIIFKDASTHKFEANGFEDANGIFWFFKESPCSESEGKVDKKIILIVPTHNIKWIELE